MALSDTYWGRDAAGVFRFLGNDVTIFCAESSIGTGDGSSEANARAWSLVKDEAVGGDIVGFIPGDITVDTTANGLEPAFQFTNNATAANPIIAVAKYPASLMANPTSDPTATRLHHTGTFSPGPTGQGCATVGGYQKEGHSWCGFAINENDGAQCRTDCATIHYRTCVDCEFHYMHVVAQQPDPGYGSDNHSGIGCRDNDGMLVTNCYVTGYNYSADHNHNGLVRYDTFRLTILNCEFTNCTQGIYLKDSPEISGGQDELVRFNYFHDNSIDIEVASTNHTVAPNYTSVTQNLFTSQGAAYVANDTLRVRTFNNTMVMTGDRSGESGGYTNNFGDTDAPGCYNNIMVQHGPSGFTMINQRYRAAAPVAVSDYNRFYSTGDYVWRFADVVYTTLLGGGSWNEATGQDAHSSIGDPQFVDFAGGDYHLAEGSPCLTAGDTGGPVGMYITGTEIIGIRPTGGVPPVNPGGVIGPGVIGVSGVEGPSVEGPSGVTG